MKALETIKNTFETVSDFGHEHKPEILLGLGLAAGVAACVTVAFSTLKVTKVLEETREVDQKIDETAENPEIADYNAEDAEKDHKVNKIQRFAKIILAYLPCVALGGLSVMAILAAFKEMVLRNKSFKEALEEMKSAYGRLSSAVRSKYGDNAVSEVTGVTKNETIEETVKNEDGTEEKKSIEAKVASGELLPLQKLWSDSSLYTPGPGMNDANEWTISRCKELVKADIAQKRFSTLNNIYERFGYPETRAGLANGTYRKEDGSCAFDVIVEEVRRPLKGIDGTNDYRKDWLLTFVIDGDIEHTAPIAEI